MKDTTKIAKIKSEKDKCEAISFLKLNASMNLYLYEALSRLNPSFSNFFIKRGDEIIGLIHSKNNEFLHIFLTSTICETTVKRVHNKFKRIKSIFGDYVSILDFLEKAGLKPLKIRKYYFMEVTSDSFKSIKSHKSVVPYPYEAKDLLPLQIGYETEEMGVDRSLLDEDKMLWVLKKRLKGKDITAIFNNSRPVAIAHINARFESTCQIGSVYVFPSCRRKGYGLSVVSSHIERLFNDYKRVVLFVDVENKSAYNLYKKIGFCTKGKLIKARLRE